MAIFSITLRWLLRVIVCSGLNIMMDEGVGGQALSSDKTLIKFIKKKIEENPRRWHEVLSEALWHIAFHGMVLQRLLLLS